MDRIVLPNTFPLGGVADWPIEVFGSDGLPATTVVLGTTTLKSRDPETGVVTTQGTPGQAVSYADEGSSKYRVLVDLSDAALIASGFFADGKEIRGKIALTIDGIAGYEKNFEDSFYVGERLVVPSDFGDYLLTVRVVDDTGEGVPNAVVTARQGGVKRWMVTGNSTDPDEVGYASMYLPGGDWFVSSYGAGVSQGSGTATLPNPDEEDEDYPNLSMVLTVVRDSISAPDTPDLTTGFFTALRLGIPVAGREYVSRLIKGPTGAYANDTQPVVATSKTSPLGLVEFTHHQPGAMYGIRPKDGREPERTHIATGEGNDSYPIPGFEWHG